MTTHRDLVRSLRRSRFARLLSCETGAVAVIVALLAPVLIGAMGLGAESGYWYLTERKVQNGADVAAHGAGRRMAAGDSADSMRQTAEYLVAESGLGTGNTGVSVNVPPTSGAYADDDNAVEAVVTETVPRMFTAIYSSEPVPITARAVALVMEAGTGCVLALGDVDGAITVSGSSGSTLTECDMVANASGTGFVMSGSGSSLSANCIQTTGTATTTSNLTVACDRLRENARPLADPYAGVSEPALTGACQPSSVGSNGATTSVSAIEPHGSGMLSRRYCTGLNLRGTVTFGPGLYLIEGGDFTINSNASVIGDGVIFYLAPGVNLRFSGTATVDLSPPTAGPYAGMLIFGSRSAITASHLINGNVGSTLDGAIYAPSSHLEIKGSAQTSANSCTQFVTNTVTFTGGGTININCNNPAGASIQIPGGVSLVE